MFLPIENTHTPFFLDPNHYIQSSPFSFKFLKLVSLHFLPSYLPSTCFQISLKALNKVTNDSWMAKCKKYSSLLTILNLPVKCDTSIFTSMIQNPLLIFLLLLYLILCPVTTAHPSQLIHVLSISHKSTVDIFHYITDYN